MIFHIASRQAWTAAQATGFYTVDSLGPEGFIYCSDANQFLWVANQRFRGRRDLVLLHIDAQRLDVEVRYENLEGGTQLFPHVYGPIPTSAIVSVTPLNPDEDGAFSQ